MVACSSASSYWQHMGHYGLGLSHCHGHCKGLTEHACEHASTDQLVPVARRGHATGQARPLSKPEWTHKGGL